MRLSRIEQGTQAGCLGSLIPFPLKDIRRQHGLLPVNIQEENYCKKLEAVRVWPLRGPNGGRKAPAHPLEGQVQ